MRQARSFDPSWWRRARGPLLWLRLGELLLVLGIVWASVALFWVIVRPYGPVGQWSATTAPPPLGDYALLTRFDPFFRLVPSGATAVTSLPLKLTGVRIDEAMGRGSAIIGTPDGLQASYAIGDEVMPGIRLKAVAFDNVTIDRGGTPEQLFIDQSIAAPVATPGATPAVPGVPASGTSVVVAPALGAPVQAQSLASTIGFDPHVENGRVTGFVVQPKGSGEAFRAAGFQPGDVVTSVNGRELHGLDDAAQAVGSAGRDAIVTFAVNRGGRTITLATKSPK